MHVAVIGAGVIGLSCAIRLAEAGHAVRVVAERRTPGTTSDVAAAIWLPFLAEPREQVLAWGTTTLNHLRELATTPHSGVQWRPTSIFSREERPAWTEIVDGYEAKTEPTKFGYQHNCTVPIIAMPTYMAFLEAWAVRLGVTFEERKLRALGEAEGADLIVNCTGLGSRELVGDKSVVPIQGQVVRIHAPEITRALLDESEPPTYIVPRSNDVVIGGTSIRGAESLVPDAAVEADILRRARTLHPTLSASNILGRAVGLRPWRPTIRLERETTPAGTVIHCYGHGGSGVTLSWGCAQEVVALAASRKPL